jgi:hypothetical protein
LFVALIFTEIGRFAVLHAPDVNFRERRGNTVPLGVGAGRNPVVRCASEIMPHFCA